MNQAFHKAISTTSQAELARQLGIKAQAISGWKKLQQIPVGRVLAVEKITGVPRYELRPDIYPPPKRPS